MAMTIKCDVSNPLYGAPVSSVTVQVQRKANRTDVPVSYFSQLYTRKVLLSMDSYANIAAANAPPPGQQVRSQLLLLFAD